MKRCYSPILRSLVCVAILASAAYASDPSVKDELNPTPGNPENIIATNCDLAGYKSGVQVFTPPVAIPDNNPAGATFGPITIADDGSLIDDVVIDLSIAHTWIGDLVIRVGYDEGCDGAIDVSSTVICRPGNTGCVSTGGVGCSANFLCNNNSPYMFDDIAPAALPTTGCSSTTNVAAGCYRPTGAGAGPLSIFEGHRKGGCWYIFASDNASLDTGTICQWSVHLKNRTTIAVTPVSWSGAKVLFN